MPRTAKVFMTNRSQAVRLPKEFQFATDEVLIRKVGDDVILSPRPRDWRVVPGVGAGGVRRVHGRRRGPARPGTGALMPRFMLDTDTCSYIMKRSHPLVLKRLQAVPVDDVCMSVVTKAELLYGVEVSPRRAQDAAALAAFLPYVEAVDFDDDAALHYAEIRADLKQRGALIGANDLFIAAHARALGLTLVTNNTAEFERVPGPHDRELDASDSSQAVSCARPTFRVEPTDRHAL